MRINGAFATCSSQITLRTCYCIVFAQEKCGDNVTAAAGTALSFNCTLDVNCFTERVRWIHHPPGYNSWLKKDLWCSGVNCKSAVELRGVSVDENPTDGWSVLKIPSVRLADRGIFQCYMIDRPQCQMNFQLSVTGNS